MERVSEIPSKVNQGESKFFLESWNQKAKDSFLKKEFKNVFKQNQDNTSINTLFKNYFIGYIPKGEDEPFYADFIY